MVVIHTRRLDLRAATIELLLAAVAGPGALARALAALVPATWPPLYLDTRALEFCRARLERAPGEGPWWLYFVLLRCADGAPVLVGTAGFKGPPADGMVEVGYGIVAEHQRQGFAAEAVGGLLDHAFAAPGVRRVIAETYPELAPSIGVLAKHGFRRIGGGSEPGVIRFERTRADHLAARASEP